AFISRLIGRALSADVKPCQINIGKLSEDYRNNWIGTIVGRDGNWQGGQVHGNDLRHDNCIGGEFVRCPKNLVGGITEYFGNGPTKFRASQEGSILVMQSWANTKDPFIGFIDQEMSQYIVRPNFD